jgi:sterol desaturase/sphingolipid hydroxylase (fatty acid hydroxylase superfamily)
MVVVIVIGVALAMFVAERARPARAWPSVSGWWARAALANGLQIAAVFLAGLTWEPWFRRHRLLSLRELGFGPEVVVGYLVNAVSLYWTHRARHEIAPLWRWLHQLHHSPSRVEILTAFYKHPLEICAESVLAAAILYLGLGLSPRAVLVISVVSGSLGLFYHWNVSTPRWLGYIVQRPESHCVHHEQGVHAYNYSELPLLDMIFGTFRNPPTFSGACGFDTGREHRFVALLLGRDVNAERTVSPKP